MANRTAARRERWGNRLQAGADFLCHARRVGGEVMCLYNMRSSRPRNWGATVAVAANYATDKADGVLARRAAAVLDRPPTDEGKKLDQTVDKAAHNAIALSHILTAFQRREHVFATVMAVSLGIQAWRDRLVNDKRDEATQVAADTGVPIHVGSIPSSKIKMGIVAAADIATQSPLADSRGGRIALGVAHLSATVLSLTTGSRIIGDLNGGIADAIGEPYPVDTLPELAPMELPVAPTK